MHCREALACSDGDEKDALTDPLVQSRQVSRSFKTPPVQQICYEIVPEPTPYPLNIAFL
jgi:hypothetical protein